jgi:hypothetical protein
MLPEAVSTAPTQRLWPKRLSGSVETRRPEAYFCGLISVDVMRFFVREQIQLRMKNKVKGVVLICLMVMASIAVSAQSVTSSLVVSKDVQRVANKQNLENEDLTKSNITAQSQPFPAIVVSKGIVRSDASAADGNIVSKGYPTWAISKGVARQNQERIRATPSMNSRDKELFTGDELSRK